MDENITIFVESNKPLISSKVNEENANRTALGNPPLTNEEIHENVIEMFNLNMAGTDITEYKFKKKMQVPQNIRQPIINPTKPQTSTPKLPNEKKTTFEILECDNGFLLTAIKNGVMQSYIFKEEKDMAKIFRSLFHLKQKEVKCKRLKSLEVQGSKSLRKKRKSENGIQ